MEIFKVVKFFSWFFFIMGSIGFFTLLIVAIGKSFGRLKETKVDLLVAIATVTTIVGFVLFLVGNYVFSK